MCMDGGNKSIAIFYRVYKDVYSLLFFYIWQNRTGAVGKHKVISKLSVLEID